MSLRGLACFAQILWTCAITRVLVWTAGTVGWTLLRLMSRFENYVVAPICFAVWSRTDKQQFISRSQQLAADINSLGLEAPQLIALKEKAMSQPRVEIGEFDQDGCLLSEFGPIRNLPCVTTANFVRRNRSSVRLVLLGDSVVVEKDFRGIKSSFVRELSALRKLNAAGCPVPAILDVDVKKCRLTMSLSKGKVLREELAKAGAVLRDRDVVGHSEYRGLEAKALGLKRIEAGRKLLPQVVSKEFVQNLYRTLQDIHSAGVTPMNIKYGNIIIEEGSGEPSFVDFGGASPLSPCGKFLFNLLRDYDLERFNLHFGTHYLTYGLLRARLKEVPAHTSVYLGYGLSLGNPWKAGARYGLWRSFISPGLPSVAGKRVLNLHARNGFHALQLLRLGARQVVAVESDANLVKQGQFVKEASEWTDNRRYDLEYIQMEMMDLVKRDLGRFDVVFAPCSEDRRDAFSMASVIRHLGTITQVLVCQSNVGEEIGRTNGKVDEMALPQPSRQLLEQNGFRVCGFITLPFSHQAFLIAETAQMTKAPNGRPTVANCPGMPIE